MTPRPLHRWKSFWFGMLVVGFLGWAWWDSLHWETSLSYGQRTLRHAGSGICLADFGYGVSISLRWDRGPISSAEALWKEVRFDAPEVVRASGDSRQVDDYNEAKDGNFSVPRNAAAVHFNELLFFPDPGAWAIYIPHWLMLTCFLVPWSAFIAWRWRRLRRILTKAPHDTAAAP